MNSRQSGLSLTEVMVAIALLATATAGGLGALAQVRASHRAAGEQQQLHERAQYAFATLEPEIQMAGYFGTSAASAAHEIPETALACDRMVVGDLDMPLTVLSTWTLPCAARNGGAMPGSDALVVRRVAAHQASAAVAGRAQWLSQLTPAHAGALYWNGEAPWTVSSAQPGSELRDLSVGIYYVARQSDGDAQIPALRVKALSSVAGVPTFIDTEVMPGVESMHVELLPSATAPRAARIELHVAARGRGADTSRTVAITRTFALRNAAR